MSHRNVKPVKQKQNKKITTEPQENKGKQGQEKEKYFFLQILIKRKLTVKADDK